MKHLKLVNSLNVSALLSQLKRFGVTLFFPSCGLHSLAFSWHQVVKLVK